MILIDLVYNLSVLVAFSVMSGFIDARYSRSELNGKILQGVLFGITSIIGMLNPFILTDGIIFDGRSIVLSLCALFFGPISGSIAAFMSIVFRIYIGGSGILMGILVITSSFLIGLTFHYWRNNHPEKPLTKLKLYILGLLVHAAMLISVIALPSESIIETYKIVTASVIGVYPIATLLIGKILMDQEENQIYIDKMKKAEEALSQSEERYKSIFQNNHAAMLLIDPETGLITDANPAAVSFYGWSIEKLKTMNINEINTLSYNEINEQMGLAVKGKRNSFEFLHRLSDGSLKNVQVYAGTIQVENKHYLLSIIHDVTDKKIAQEEIIKLNRALEQSSVSILITDAQGKIEYTNPYFTTSTGFTFEEVKGQNPRILKSGYQDPEFYKDLWETILSGRNWKGELLNQKKNGHLIWENIIISPIINATGKITHFVSIREDVSEKKRMLQEIIEAKEKAEISDKLKSEFLAQISHEIRSPINTIINFSSLIEMELSDTNNEIFDTSFAGIKSAGSRIIRTIDLILNMSELQLGTYEPISREIDLKLIVPNLVKEYYKSAELKNLKINCISTCSNSVVRSDDYAVTQILANLIDNAIKYTKEGSVTVLLTDGVNNSLKVLVKDTGIGISKEYLSNLFVPFTQEEHGYSRRFEGNGLGLALIKKYCDLLGLVIDVESEKSIGTIFTVTFPAEKIVT